MSSADTFFTDRDPNLRAFVVSAAKGGGTAAGRFPAASKERVAAALPAGRGVGGRA